jgi:Putative beta-barrel porin-2, OmpL-like. bbp2
MNRVTSLTILISLVAAWESQAQQTIPPLIESAPLPSLNSTSPSVGEPSGSSSPIQTGTCSPATGSAYPPLMTQQYCYTNPTPGTTSDGVTHLLSQDGRFRAYGWLDAGGVYNTQQPGSGFNGPYNAVDSTTPTFNQAYLVMEMKRPDNSDFGVGGRVDVLYGNDFFLAQSAGFELNRDGSRKWNSNTSMGLTMPQAYLEVGSDTLSVQVGHFYTIVGYEGVQSANNFFYSHAYSYQFAGPFTQWGGLVTWRPDSNWEVQAGPVNGWNTLDGTPNNVEFLGKAKYTSDSKDWWTSFAVITGNMPNNAAFLPGIAPATANRTRYSFLYDRKITNNLEYVFHQWLGAQQDGTTNGSTANWYGIDQYMFYTISKNWKFGGRFEWFRDEAGTRVGLTRPGNPNVPPLPGNYFSFTVGPNYSPNPNLVVRPEIRYDTYNGSAQPFDDGRKTQQLMFGVDVIVKF